MIDIIYSWGWPQWVFASLYVYALFESLAKEGKSKGQYNFGYTLASVLIGVGILHFGGFWSP